MVACDKCLELASYSQKLPDVEVTLLLLFLVTLKSSLVIIGNDELRVVLFYCSVEFHEDICPEV